MKILDSENLKEGVGSTDMVVDCFTFYNEIETLKLRLSELNQYVDKFILVEAKHTFQGNEKQLCYEDNKDLFAEWSDKIVHVTVEKFPDECVSTWDKEAYQRNQIKVGLDSLILKDDDVVLISDVDEIPNLRNNFFQRFSYHLFVEGAIVALRCRLFYYFLNMEYVNNEYNEEFLFDTRICSYKTYREKFNESSNDIRRTNLYFSPYANYGWHFSFLGSAKTIINKIESFSHSEYNTDEFKNKQELTQKMFKGEDLFNRGLKFRKINPEDRFMPKYINENYFELADKGLIAL